MNMKRSLILLCGLLTGFTLQSTKVNAQTQTVANDQKLVYPYTFAPSEGLVNQTEKEHRQEICINGYWDFQPVRLPKEYVQGKGIAPRTTPAGKRQRMEQNTYQNPFTVEYQCFCLPRPGRSRPPQLPFIPQRMGTSENGMDEEECHHPCRLVGATNQTSL